MGLEISTANSSLYFSIDWPTDDDGSRRDDIVGAKIWMSQTDGFTPGESSLAHDGPDLSAVVPGLESGAVYYVRYAIVSGIDQDDVAISDQITAPAVNDANPATLIRIVSEDAVISQSSDGSFSPSLIAFTAEQVTGNGLPEPYMGRFRIVLNGSGVTEYQSTTDESSVGFTVPDGTTKIWCALFEAGGTTTRLDAVTIPVLVDGAWAMSIVVTNPAHAVPCSSAGSPLSYVGSGTDIRVYVGDTELVYDGVGTTKGTWTATASGTGITPGSISDSGDYATVGAHSGMTTDTASVSYTITGKRAGGAAFSRTVKQSLTKAKAGATGATGATGSTGSTGAQGQRGAGNFYATATSAAWSDTVANNKITSVTGSPTKITGDSVTESFGSPVSWVLTKAWNGSSWEAQGTVFDGSLFVTESITSASINTSGFVIKNSSGVVKTSFDPSGNLQLSGDIVLEGGDIYGKAGKFSALHGSSNQGSASCYCYASDYTYNSQYYGAAALRSAWSDPTGEAVGGAASLVVYSALSTGSDYGGIPFASTIRGTVNGSQTIVIGQNSITMRGEASHLRGTFQTSGMLKCTRTVNPASLTDAAMWLSASYGSLVFDSDANKSISWNDGNSFAIRSGNRAAGGTANVPVAGDGAVKIVMNTDSQNGSCGIYAAPIVTTAGGSPSWTHNIIVTSSGVTIDGGNVWHSGNDGSGSGLDADLLDGMHTSTINTVSSIVSRDASGNFSAGTITAASFSGPLDGTASNSSALGGYSVTGFARLDTTTGNDNKFLHLHRNSGYGVLYVNQMGAGFYARFFTGATSSDTFGANEIILEKSGNVSAVSFSGSGANLTTLNASNLSSGTVPIARIPTGTTSETVSLGNHTHSDYAASSHTHSYAGSASAGGAASSVANSLVLKIAGGTTEGTNQYTFNGSAAKTLNFVAGTNVSLAAGSGSLTINSTYSYTHPNSGVAAGTYKSVTVNDAGHVTSGTNPTTLSGYGITDAATSSHLHTGTYLPLAGGTMSPGGWITMNGGSIWTANEISCSHSIHPTNGSTTTTCGTSTNKFQAVYATTGTIQTSDARKKTGVYELTEQELDVAVELSKKIGTFQFLASVAEKGADSARKHIGMTVQEAASVFEAHGLDPWRYGFMCHDAWGEITNGDGTIPAGDEFSFRPDELLLFVAAGINERLARLEAA